MKSLAVIARMLAVSALSPIDAAAQPSQDNHIPIEGCDVIPVITLKSAGTGIAAAVGYVTYA